jgi:hypothetical protein
MSRSGRSRIRHYVRLRPGLVAKASGFTTSRAQSMKSRATGLIVRCFRVTIATGLNSIGSVTGNTMSDEPKSDSRSSESGTIVR